MTVCTDNNPAPLSELLQPYRPPFTNLVDHLEFWADTKSDHVAFGFYPDGETLRDEWTYEHLYRRAKAVAAELQNRKLQGQRVLLLYPPSLQFIEAFFGCQFAGAIPVPAFPPRKSRNGGRIDLIAQDADAKLVFTVRETITRMESMLDETECLKEIPILASEEIPDHLGEEYHPIQIKSEDIGLLQYTSGSTGSPKGVVLTHGNLIENCKMITYAFQIFQQGVGVSWLPTYHDMGLVGGVLNPLFIGRASYLMPPLTFLAKPVRWLKAISDRQAHISGGPNFAYQLCVDKIDDADMEGIDLSTWEVAFNGAEPIRSATLKAFNDRFSSNGFSPTAHYPCYGMAETTLLVTGGYKSEPPIVRSFDRAQLDSYRAVPSEGSESRELVGCGHVQPDEEIIIVEPNTLELLSEKQIGEIWVNGTSVGKGYWEKPEESEKNFGATYQGDNTRYLRTGDLGFLADNELYVTGRLKDMIIVRGVNRYPQDIEATVEESSDKLQTSGTAAFAVDVDGAEKLIVVSEIERSREKNWTPVIELIRKNVTAEHDLPPDAIVMVRTGSIQKTSSGKIQRHACKAAFEQGELKVVDKWISWSTDEETAESTSSTDSKATDSKATDEPNRSLDQAVVDVVVGTIKEVGKERAKNLSLNTNIVIDLGLDSLERLQIANNLEEYYGARFPEEVLQEIETVQEVVSAILEHFDLTEVAKSKKLETRTAKRIDGEIPDEFFDFAKTPEVIRFERQKKLIAQTGVRNPFFSVHDGSIGDQTEIDGRKLISFASYNYLGLSGNPEVTEASKQAIDRYGTSVSASRLVSGEKVFHRELESELASFLGVEDVLVLTGGHATNESVVGFVVGRGDLIIHDELAHNSIIQGAILSGATRRPFPHNDWEALDKILTEIRRDYRRVLIAVEGLYSMDGDFPNVPKFLEIKKKHKCFLYLDEAHSIGTMGETGRGICEHFDVNPLEVDFLMGTMSKSLGSFGGFIGANAKITEYMRYNAPSFVFAAGLPGGVAAASLKALQMIQQEPERVNRLRENSQLLLQLCREAGLNTGESHNSPIIPVITGDSLKALKLSEALFLAGINAQPILHPAVEEDRARVRFFVTSLHREEQIRRTVEVLSQAWQEING